MRFLILENNIVVNAIYADEAFIEKSGLTAVKSDIGDIGDFFDGSNFTSPGVSILPEHVSLKPIYMRLALMQFGMLPVIESELEKPGNEMHKIAFEYALEFKRDDQMINAFASAMGLSTEQVDALFLKGMELQNA